MTEAEMLVILEQIAECPNCEGCAALARKAIEFIQLSRKDSK